MFREIVFLNKALDAAEGILYSGCYMWFLIFILLYIYTYYIEIDTNLVAKR